MRQSIEQMTRNNQKGFTLAELLIAMTLSLIVLGAVHSIYRVQAHTVKAQEYRMEAQEYARTALDMMVREIRNLGYFPTQVVCTDVLNTKGIIAASATNFQFVYDANGLNGCADVGENITYSYNGSDIIRTINDGNGPQVLTAGNVTAASFSYFDAAGVVITVPANIPTFAKRVSVSLTVQSRSPDVQFGGLQSITMNSNLDLRNR